MVFVFCVCYAIWKLNGHFPAYDYISQQVIVYLRSEFSGECDDYNKPNFKLM